MKHLLYLILFVTPTLGLGQTISIEIDTLDILYNGRLAEVAYYEDHFYLMFETKRKNTSQRFKSMKVYDTNGNFVENVSLPKEVLSMPYYDLRVINQRLYLKQEDSFSEKTFLLEKYVANFNQIKDTVINIHEDSYFIIYPNCWGEWGASTYFQNKNDKKVYEFSSSCNFNFEQTESGYLLTNGNEILIISDPTQLYESELTFDRSYLDKRNQGIDTLFKSKFDLYTIFEMDNKLMVIYGDSLNTHIGELRNGELKSAYEFNEPYRFSYWFKDNNTNTQILKIFIYESIDDFGFLEGYEMLGFALINAGRIKMYYLK